MAMQKAYQRINWENLPSEKTPVDEINLNKMDKGIDDLDDRIVDLDTKVDTITNAGGASAGYVKVYIINNSEPFSYLWLSDSAGGNHIKPNANVLYIIQTPGKYYGMILQWDVDSGTYRLASKKNIKSDSIEVRRLIAAREWSYPAEIDIRSATPGFQFPNVKVGDEIYCKMDYFCNNSGGSYLYVGIRNTSTWKGLYSPTSWSTYENSFVVTENTIGNGVFEIARHAGGYVDSRSIYRNVYVRITPKATYDDYDTNEYVAPNDEYQDGQSGLLPAPKMTELGFFGSDGKWYTIEEIKQLLQGNTGSG